MRPTQIGAASGALVLVRLFHRQQWMQCWQRGETASPHAEGIPSSHAAPTDALSAAAIAERGAAAPAARASQRSPGEGPLASRPQPARPSAARSGGAARVTQPLLLLCLLRRVHVLAAVGRLVLVLLLVVGVAAVMHHHL